MKKGLKYSLIAVVAVPILLIALGISTSIVAPMLFPEYVKEQRKIRRDEIIADSIAVIEKARADSIKKVEIAKAYEAEQAAKERAKEEAFKRLPEAEQQRIIQERKDAEARAYRDSYMRDFAKNYIKERYSKYKDFNITDVSWPHLEGYKYSVIVDYSYTPATKVSREVQESEVLEFNSQGSFVSSTSGK